MSDTFGRAIPQPSDLIRRGDVETVIRNAKTGSQALEGLDLIAAVRVVEAAPARAPRTLEDVKDATGAANASEAIAATPAVTGSPIVNDWADGPRGVDR